ncbi:MAG: hypothetical protein KAS70_03770 [Planctomycetes bacterium]|nr:hypothetical protein [Planctomycetota bacterium]
MEAFIQALWNPVQSALATIGEFMPNLAGALVVLFLGLIVARVLKGVVKKLLDAIKFNVITEKSGVDAFLEKGGLKTTGTNILSTLVYWLVIIMILAMMVDILKLKGATDLFQQLFGYLPNVIVAVFVLVFGLFIGVFLSSIVTTAASNAHIPQAKLLGGMTKYAVLVFAVIISLLHLDIKIDFIVDIFKLVFAAICFASALAFGLGGKEVASKYLSDWTKK